jgi:four helix bundle protein
VVFKNFRTYEMAKSFYQSCKSVRLRSPLKDQFERASLSIVLNLAEGSGKPTAKDRKRFYSIAMGSFREVQALLDIQGEEKLLRESDSLGASLYRLIQNPGGS